MARNKILQWVVQKITKQLKDIYPEYEFEFGLTTTSLNIMTLRIWKNDFDKFVVYDKSTTNVMEVAKKIIEEQMEDKNVR